MKRTAPVMVLGMLAALFLASGCGGGDDASSAPPASGILAGVRVEMHYDPG